MRVTFLVDHTEPGPAHETTYTAGESYVVHRADARRWVAQGVAAEVSGAPSDVRVNIPVRTPATPTSKKTRTRRSKKHAKPPSKQERDTPEDAGRATTAEEDGEAA